MLQGLFVFYTRRQKRFAVIENYKVDGILIKVVFDRNNIRFKSIGYNGSAEGT